jgi:hypothetical protein
MISDTTRLVFLCFFASHIPISLLLDGQIFLPLHWFPQVIQDVRGFYVSTFCDTLIAGPPFHTWFQSLVACELLFQVPYFVLAVHMLLRSSKRTTTTTMMMLPRWFQSLSIIYGTHAATTLVPILASILWDDEITSSEKLILFGFYLPYFLFPASWVYIMVRDDDDEEEKPKSG